MNRSTLNAKIHRATGTGRDRHDVGSIIVKRLRRLQLGGAEPLSPRIVHLGDANRIIAIDSDVATLMAAPAA